MNERLRKFHIFHINCDCASYYDARQRMPNSMRFMRCIYCKKQLGDMQIMFKGTVHAESDREAITLCRLGKATIKLNKN